MRTSGRGKSEWLMVVGPAAIFGIFFIGMYGAPMDVVKALDRFLVNIIDWTVAVVAAVVGAIT